MSQALVELGISNFELDGTPTTEKEFNESFTKITGFDENRTIIRSTNPDDFGVDWTKVKAKYDELVAAEPLKELREVRNRLLNESDWTRMDDNGLTDEQKAKWAKYRQDLRDITKTATSLDDVTWPTKP